MVACTHQAPRSDLDSIALATLAKVAGPTSNVPIDQIEFTECWLPSDHMIRDPENGDAPLWRVMCRVHHADDSGDRYQDTTCVGDFSRDPMLDHCYRWTYYDLMPRFEDHAGTIAR